MSDCLNRPVRVADTGRDFEPTAWVRLPDALSAADDEQRDALAERIARAMLPPIHEDEDRSDLGWDDVRPDRFLRYAAAVVDALCGPKEADR